MNRTTSAVNTMLEELSHRWQVQLKLQEGVCALYGANEKELAVLEVPEQSEQLLLHCNIAREGLTEGDAFNQLALKLNFEMSAMRGCWLALDEYQALRLCSSYEINALTVQKLEALLTGFMHQVDEVRGFFDEIAA